MSVRLGKLVDDDTTAHLSAPPLFRCPVQKNPRGTRRHASILTRRVA